MGVIFLVLTTSGANAQNFGYRLFSIEDKRALETNLSQSYLNGAGCQLKEPYRRINVWSPVIDAAVPPWIPVRGNAQPTTRMAEDAWLVKYESIWYCPPRNPRASS